MAEYPDAAAQIKAWADITEASCWHNFAEVRSTFSHADYVDDCVIFDIGTIDTGLFWRTTSTTTKATGIGGTENMGAVLANPIGIIARGGPHVIHNDEELEVYTEELFKLTALENPSPAKEGLPNSYRY